MKQSHYEEGQGLLEYGLILILVAIAVVAILTLLGPPVAGMYARVVGGIHGQSVMGTGDEVVVDHPMTPQESGGTCTFNLPAGSTAIPLRDGRPMANTTVTITIWANGNSGSSTTVSTNNFGVGNTAAAISASASCPATVSYTMNAP